MEKVALLDCKIAKRFKYIIRRKKEELRKELLIRVTPLSIRLKYVQFSDRRHVHGVRHRDRHVGHHPGSYHVEHVTNYPGDGGSENPVESGHGVRVPGCRVPVNRGDGAPGYPAGGCLMNRNHGADERQCYRLVRSFYIAGITTSNRHGIVIKLSKQPLLACPVVLAATVYEVFYLHILFFHVLYGWNEGWVASGCGKNKNESSLILG